MFRFQLGRALIVISLTVIAQIKTFSSVRGLYNGLVKAAQSPPSVDYERAPYYRGFTPRVADCALKEKNNNNKNKLGVAPPGPFVCFLYGPLPLHASERLKGRLGELRCYASGVI